MTSVVGLPSVLHQLYSFGFGGTERVAAGLLLRARERGERVDLIMLQGGSSWNGMREELGWDPAGPRVRNPDERTRGNAVRLAWHARKVAGDVVHAHLPWPDLMGAALLGRGRRPALITFHLLSPTLGSFGEDLVFGPWAARAPLAYGSSRLARLILVALTHDDARRIRRALPGCRVEIVANAPPAPTPGEPIALPFGTGSKLLFVGRLHEQKGLDRLMDALATEPMRSAAWSLCVVGDGEARDALAARSRERGLDDRIRFVGSLPGSRVLSQADWLLAPSRFEGMPLTVLEGMEAGLPVIASSIPSHREVLASTPEAILPEATDRWSEVLHRCTDGVLRDRVRSAQSEAFHSYTRAAQDRAYAELYRDLVR